MEWEIRRIDLGVVIADFDCGERSLNLFLQKHALNNDRAGLGRTYVALESGNPVVAGYFTISSGTVRADTFPQAQTKRLPKYPIPTVHLGRLAVDQSRQGSGLGKILLVESLRRAALTSKEIGIYAIDVIALHEKARAFYLKFGFVQMLDDPLHLFMSMQTAIQLAD